MKLLLLTTLLLSGCVTTFSPIDGKAAHHVDGYEITYQALAAIDYSQTLDNARRPDCVREYGFAENFIGAHPSATSTSVYFAATGSAHALVSGWLNREVDATDSDTWRVARTLWRTLGIGFEAYTVAGNFQHGVYPFGHHLTAACGG